MSNETKDTSVDIKNVVISPYSRVSGGLIDKSQPLNTIGIGQTMNSGVVCEDGPPISVKWENSKAVCDVCQIPRFIGSCEGCGIYQYCLGKFDDNDQFEIIGVRRINNGISSESSDVESDS